MRHLVHLSELEAGPAGAPVLAGLAAATRWRRFDVVALAPGEVYAPSPESSAEPLYVVLSGRAACASEEAAVEVEATALLRCAPGQAHAVTNPGPEELRMICAQAERVPAAAVGPVLLVAAADRQRLSWRPALHGGVGRVATRHLWGPADFHGGWTFADHAVLDAFNSVGYHHHEGLDECFVMLNGRGLATVGERTFATAPGDVTWQGVGQAHGLYNPHREELEFLRLAVRRPGEPFATIDRDDDLASRRPAPRRRHE